MKPDRKTALLNKACWTLGTLPLLFVLIATPFLPQQIPIHFDFSGNVDRFGGWGELFFLAAAGLGITALLRFLPSVDPKRSNYARFAKSYAAIRLLAGIFFFVLTVATLTYGLWPGLFSGKSSAGLGRFTLAGVGLLLCACGNFMPKFKQNYFCGIRTPWALANAENWRRTHRFGGAVWFWCGLSIAAVTLLPSFALQEGVLLALASLCLALPVGYSFWIYKNDSKCRENLPED